MTILPPSPFVGSCPADTAAAPPVSSQAGAAADLPDIPLAELERRGFDAEGFLNDIEPLPAFLSAPSAAYLTAREIFPVLRTLAGH
jgi:hypothetical protein